MYVLKWSGSPAAISWADSGSGQGASISIRFGLTAKLHRNVYYQLAEHVSAVYCNGQLHYQIKSGGFPYTFAISSSDAGR